MFKFGKFSSIGLGLMLAFVLTLVLVSPASAQVNRNAKKSASGAAIGSSSVEAKRLFLQAKAFHDGINVVKDFRKARRMYLKAAGLGSNDARVNLGYLYFVGEGVPQNYTKAHNWYLSAARTGSKDAQMNLALMYKNGLGVEKDLEKATFWRKYDTMSKYRPKPKIKPKTQPRTKAGSKNPAKLGQQSMQKSPAKTAVQTGAGEKTNVKNARPVLQIQDQKIPISLVAAKLRNGNSDIHIQSGLRPRSFQKPAVQSIKALNLGAAPSQTFKLPVWTGNTLVVALLLLSVFGSIWFARQYGALLAAARGHAFKEAFYAHHRESLRTNYLKYPQRQSFHSRIDDPWALAMCVLMVRFAQANAKIDTRVGEQSRKILGAYKLSPMDARKCVFKFVANIQERIVLDIYAYDCAQKNAAKPIQYSQKIKARNIVKLHSGHQKKPGVRVELFPVKPSAE